VKQTEEERIEEFKKRIEVEPEFCLELFEYATVRLMCHKYAYYVKSIQFVEDIAYDGEEKGWFIMGRALGLLKEDETSPCVDFDPTHPKADEGIALANTLKPK
jgi:hypothetical protein